MGNIQIISNNSLALDKYAHCAVSVAGGVFAVFCAARDKIHTGARLINHPLSGSVKPNQNPYKSLILSAANGPAVDIASLTHIEEAIGVLSKLAPRLRGYSEAVHEDFKVIDLDLLDAAIKAIENLQ